MFHISAMPVAVRKDGVMVGHTLFVTMDVLGIVLGAFGIYLGMTCLDAPALAAALLALANPIDVVNNLNQFFTQLTALIGTLGCMIAAGSIALQNLSKGKRQMFEGIQGNRDEIAAVKQQSAEEAAKKDQQIAELKSEITQHRLATDAAQAELAVTKSELHKLHSAVRTNSAIVRTVKMEVDEHRKAMTPDPDRGPIAVEIVNTKSHPVPTVTQPQPEPETETGGPHA